MHPVGQNRCFAECDFVKEPAEKPQGLQRRESLRYRLAPVWKRNTRSRLFSMALACFTASLLWPTAIGALGLQSGASSDISHENAHTLYQAGMRLIQQRRTEDAIQTFKQGLRGDPQNLVLLNAIGAAYVLENNAQQADQYFLAALNVDPQFTPARKNLAISYFARGRLDLATREFERLHQDQEAGRTASLFLGMIAAKKNEYSRAITYFDESGTLAYQYSDSVVAFAQALYECQRPREGQHVLDRLRDVSAVTADNWLHAGTLYSRLGRYQEALDSFARALQRNPQSPGIEYQEALVLLKMGRSSDALGIVQKLAIQNPGKNYLNQLGHAADDAGNIQLALEALRKAVELAPAAEENYLDFSTLCMKYGNNAVALKIVKVGLARLHHAYRLTVQEGAILNNLGRQQQAEAAFRAAIPMQNDDREAFLGLAITLTDETQFEDALKTFAAGIHRFPNDYPLRYYYSAALLKLAEHNGMNRQAAARARQSIEKAIRLNPGSADPYYLLAKFYFAEHQPLSAQESLELCLHIDAKYVPAQYELALTYLKSGRKQEGERLLRQVKAEQAQELKKDQSKPRVVLARR